MHVVARCPECDQVVTTEQKTCPNCATRLTRAKFEFTSVLLYGAIGVALAFVISLIIIPLAVIGIVVALFARQKLHVINFENSGGGDQRPGGKVFDI